MTVQRLRPFSVNIFARMSALAASLGAVNLGQGFPDEDGPAAMLEVARQAIADGVNQYPPGPGIAELRAAVAGQRDRRYGQRFDPESEVLITVGASEAIAATVLGLVEPGSEVILIEPYFDTYAPVIAMAGAHRVPVPLVSDGRGFALDVDAVRAAVTSRTRAIIVNSPHNPTGTEFSDDECRALAALADDAN
ncbi:MAG: Pyridoxal phosphate-dependent aminotransferase, partial [Actinomycetota bacterium]|nr:Pyridoxal phosphate-dependent aminotransferase [Actinomycetota bacterium]